MNKLMGVLIATILLASTSVLAEKTAAVVSSRGSSQKRNVNNPKSAAEACPGLINTLQALGHNNPEKIVTNLSAKSPSAIETELVKTYKLPRLQAEGYAHCLARYSAHGPSGANK